MVCTFMVRKYSIIKQMVPLSRTEIHKKILLGDTHRFWEIWAIKNHMDLTPFKSIRKTHEEMKHEDRLPI